MRLPNGFGTVYKLKDGNRRNPYIVRKFVRWEKVNGKKKPKYLTLGYTRTRKLGLEMLTNYNHNPYASEAKDFTFEAIFNEWSKEKFASASKSNIYKYQAAYKACETIHYKKFIDLKFKDLQDVIDNSEKIIQLY